MTYTADETMTDEQIQEWIEKCNHEPARNVLRHYMALRQAADGRREGEASPASADVVERVNNIIVAMVRTDHENVYGARAAAKRIAELFPASGAAVQVPEGYRKFFLEVAAHCFDDGADLDYQTFTDLGVECGLLVKTMYDPEKHGSNEWGCEPGDDWFEIAAAPQKGA